MLIRGEEQRIDRNGRIVRRIRIDNRAKDERAEVWGKIVAAANLLEAFAVRTGLAPPAPPPR